MVYGGMEKKMMVLCLGKNYYTCACKIGWAGDGKVCGPDRDLDGWPDFDLPCQVYIIQWVIIPPLLLLK